MSDKSRESLTIGIVGAGGDGVVALGSLLQRIAALQGYFSQMPRYYGAQIRGGGSAVKLHLDAHRLSIPQDVPDLLLCFNWQRYLEFETELPIREHTIVLYEPGPPSGLDLPENSYPVDFSARSEHVSGSARDKNLVALGLLTRMLGLPEDKVGEAIAQERELHILKEGMAAIEMGQQSFAELGLPQVRLVPTSDATRKEILHGNDAVARAAVRAGCRAFFGYPITPAGEIMREMEEALSGLGGAFLQAEDEIAAAGLTIGASLTGTRSLTATSGPGLDLMTEMMGLATSAEIPMVIVDVQRCGPATGIPSKSEQSDLNHAVYGGHGDAPRVVLAPFDLEGCYRLVIEAVNIAEYFQCVTILLSDQWLGQTFVAANEDFLKREYRLLERKHPSEPNHYHRYALTDDLISPISSAGDQGFVYQTSGLTHTQDGAPAFDFGTHQALHEKRWKKLAPLCQRDDLVTIFGNEASSRGIVTWGSSAQVVLESVKDLGMLDQTAVCVPELIHPLPEKLGTFVERKEKLLVVEMNYSGQLYTYLRSHAHIPRNTTSYCRAGGRPFSRGELAGPVAELAG